MTIHSSLRQATYRTLIAIVLVSIVLSACSGVDARKHEFLERGQTYYNNKNYDKARVELRNALQIDPKYVEARYLAGQVAEKRNDIREAAGQYQAAVDANPKYQPARAALARIYVIGGLQDKAGELCEEGLKDDPNNAALLTVRGALHAQRGQLDQAQADAELANKQKPNDEYTISLLASLYKQSNRLDKAVEVIEEGIKQSPNSVDLHIVLADLNAARQDYAGVEAQLQQVIQLEPKSIAHRARLAQFYLFRKDVDGAEKVWRQATTELPDQVEAKLALVNLLWTQRNEEVAVSEMEKMVSSEPRNSELKLAMAGYLQRQSKLDRAEQIYQEVIKKEDRDAKGLQARDQLATLYLRRDDVKLNDESRARNLIDEVLKENARDNDALVLRANVALKHGDAATAVTDLRSVLRDQPNSTPLMRALARAHLQNNDATLAEETLRNAVQTDPADVESRKLLSKLLLQNGKIEQARPFLEQLAAQNDKVDLEILDGLFKTQLSAKDFPAAQNTVDKTQQQYPQLATGWYYAALLAEAQKNRELARKQYEHALEVQPEIAEPLVALVRMDMVDKDSKGAMNRLNAVIAKHPDNAIAHNLRGELLLTDKKWEEAANAFRQTINLASAWPVAYRNLASTQLQQKQLSEAIATYETGVVKTSDMSLVVNLAMLQENAGKPDDAIKTYDRWLVQQPKSIPVANNLVMLLLNYHGDDKNSLERAAKLSDMLATSSDPSLLDTRGWYKYKRGDYQGAVNLLQQAAGGDNVSATVRYHLGMALLKTGNNVSARTNLQAAVSSGQSFFGIDEARSALNSITQSS
ncbi:MAG TPA: tetratricopeptide repeat protein [Steroidobacteraceae bacterium]|nr:tetratricopeptide repeat protein [Steroidobacteraceae bacterium]